MKTTPWIDAHLDLAWLALTGRDLLRPCPDPGAGCTSLPDLDAGNVRVALATIYTRPVDVADGQPYTYARDDDAGANAAGRRQLEMYERLERDGAIRIIRAADELDAQDEQRLQVILLMEGADPIRSPDDAAWWVARGVRAVGLAWALGTRYAGGNKRPGPLTAAGRELVAALDELGVIHDVSHLSDEGLADLLGCARGPVVATHSNARAVIGRDDPRHLTDEAIRAIARRGGVIGLNLYSRFLRADGRATVDDCVAHVLHICEVIGHRRGVGLGSDADGGFGPAEMPAGLDHPRHYHRLLAALSAAGFDDEDLRGFASENWLRCIRSALAA